MRKLFITFLSVTSLCILGTVLLSQPKPWTPQANQINEATLEMVNDMSNEDVTWQGTYFGLLPALNGPTLILRDTQENITPLLLDATVKEDKFVAAHALLILQTLDTDAPPSVSAGDILLLKIRWQGDLRATYEAYGIGAPLLTSKGDWFGLQVQWNDGIGRMSYEGNDLLALQSYWMEKLQH